MCQRSVMRWFSWASSGCEQQRAQLRLADQDDAQQLLGGRLEVRQQAQLLQHLDRERLRLVDHHHRRTGSLALREQMAVQARR